MTDAVARARAAMEGVTEGPWLMIPELGNEDAAVISEGERAPDSITVGGHTFHPGYSVAVDLRQPDAEFIAAARSLVPELIAEVERLRQQLQNNLDDYRDLHAENGDLRKETARLGGYIEVLKEQWDRLPQQRTIETVEQLDALPQFSVIQFRGEALGESHRVVWQLDGAWFPAGSGEYNHSRDFPTEAFPAAVLWLPEWGNK